MMFGRKIRTGFIYTFNAPEERMKQMSFAGLIGSNHYFLERIFGASEEMIAADTCQFDDYSRIDQHRFDPAVKAALYACSVLPGLSRINTSSHYPSQVVLGWWIAFLAVRTVRRVLPNGCTRRVQS